MNHFIVPLLDGAFTCPRCARVSRWGDAKATSGRCPACGLALANAGHCLTAQWEEVIGPDSVPAGEMMA